MSLPVGHKCRLPGIALGLILVAAQTVAAMHDIRHESGTTQNQVCTTCVAVSQLGAAVVDTGPDLISADSFTVFYTESAARNPSAQTLAPSPRGPPAHD